MVGAVREDGVPGSAATSVAELRPLLEVVPDATIVVDAEGHVVACNRHVRDLFGWPPEDLVGRPVEVLVPEALRDVHVRHRAEYRAAPRVRPMGAGLELSALTRHGTEVPVEISLSPLETAEGTFVVASIRDVTERRRMADQLREADRLKDEFLDVAAHQLRSPLAAIGGLAEMLSRDWDRLDDTTRRQLAQRITARMHQLTGLVERLLDFSRLRAGRVTLRPRRVVVTDAVAAAISRTEETLKGHPVTMAVPPGLAVQADPEALGHILDNLLVNAATHTPPETPVAVEGDRDGNRVVITVRDEGPGVPPDIAEVIFERFVSGGGRGTGLGLHIVARYAELMGGQVWLDNDPGRGAAFRVVLPAA